MLFVKLTTNACCGFGELGFMDMKVLAMDKRYQVFVSSTYTDLKEERQSVTQTLMEMDCIPAGMELFPATDEEQWTFIKKIIDDCDYYLLIIGGRYGSLSAEGVSYTEKEYDYAVEKGLKVVALVHGSPGELPLHKSEGSPELRDKLDGFRMKATTGRLVKFWKESSELPGLVALSLTKTIRLFPALGWVRASVTSNEGLLLEINELRKLNNSLQSEMARLRSEDRAIYNIPDLAGLDEFINVTGVYFNGTRNLSWAAEITWKEIFFFISPYLVQSATQEHVKNVLRDAIIAKEHISSRMNTIDDQVFQTIAIQLKALGLVRVEVSKATDGKTYPFWLLTKKGEQSMVELRAIKKKVD